MKAKLVTLITIILLITKSHAANYYWVGGSGNWSDISHWATTSGGSTLHSVVPSPNDDVFFDAGSGFTLSSKTVTVNLINSSCQNMDWTGSLNNPIVTGNTIYIYGSVRLSSGMQWNVGYVYLRATTSASITTNGVVLSGTFPSLYFDEIGTWTLMDDLSQNSGHIYLNKGTLNTNNKTINTATFTDNYGPGPCTLNLGSSVLNCLNYSGTSAFPNWNYSKATSTLNVGTSTINISGLSTYIQTRANHTYYDINVLSNTQHNGGGTYRTLNYYKDAYISSSITVQNINLTSGHTYTLGSSTTLSVTSVLNMNATGCLGSIYLKSSQLGTQSTITAVPSATINVNNCVIQDSKVQGGATFNATNSFDSGNNTGWTFTSPPVNNLYWVGGAGNWNDQSHWSLSSGGVGGGCVPSPNTNVFFDGGSGFTVGSKTVTVVGPSFCKNFTCAGMTTLAIFTSTSTLSDALYIYGSSIFQTGMNYTNLTTWYQSNNPETITTNAVTFNNSDVSFFGNGSWTLQDAMTQTYAFASAKIVYLHKGLFNTNNNNCTFYRFSDNGTNLTHTLTLGSSNVNITTALSGQWDYAGIGAFLTANTSTINLTGISSSGNAFFNTKTNHVYNVVNLFDKTNLSGNNTFFNNVTFYKGSSIFGSNTFTVLTLGIASPCKLGASSTQTVINTFNSLTPTCGGWATIESNVPGFQAKIYVPATGTVSVRNCQIKDIQALGGAVFSATTSIDGGNNTGWTFGAVATNSLYWVGGAGDWNDINHWAFTSGGTGGACVPGPSDDVFIDVNSGLTASSRTITASICYCHNITCTGATIPAKITTTTSTSGSGTAFNLYGSMVLQAGMGFSGFEQVKFLSSANETILTQSVTLNWISSYGGGDGLCFYGGGRYTLLDSLTTSYGVQINFGTRLNLNGKRLSCLEFNCNATSGCDITNSYLRASTFNNSSPTGSFVATNSTIECTFFSPSPTFYSNTNNTGYNYVFFPTKGGISTTGLHTFKKIFFAADGIIRGSNEIDTLIFTPDRVYQLDATKTQTITSAFYPSGNPCFVTFIQSTIAGTQASLNIQSGNVNYDYVNIRDVNATPSYTALQFAGHTTNTGNNTNMVFAPTTTVGIVGLGPDVTACQSTLPLTLNTTAFYPNPFTQYTWTGGTTSNSLVVNSGGTYSVLVNYGAGCTVADNVVITANPTPTITATGTSICSGASTILTASGANTYTWVSPSATTNTILVSPSTSTVYTIMGTSSAGCTNTLTNIPVTVNATPTIAIASVSNNSICIGNNSIITPNGANTYTLLNTGATGTSFTVNPTVSTTYSVVGTSLANCNSNNFAPTTIVVNATPTVAISSVSNASICSGNSTTITASGASTYTLTSITTTLTSNPFVVSPTSNTTYTIIGKSVANCASGNSATSLITVNATPTVAISSVSSASICSGNNATITASGASTYTLTSSTTTLTSNPFVVSPTSNTSYTLVGSSAANCKSTNPLSTLINVNATPTITTLGATSATICSGEVFTLTPTGASAGNYTLMPGNITTSTVFTVSPITNTTYSINGANTNGCVSTTSSDLNVSLTVNTTPTVNALFSSNALCASQNVTIALSGADASYTLNPGNTSISASTASAIITPTAGTTIYTITATNSNGCVSTLANQIYTTSVSVVTNPTITASAITSSICSGTTAFITPFGASTFTLMPDNIVINSGQTFTLNPTVATTYTINGTATGGCTSIASTQLVTTINIYNTPTITAASVLSNTICSGLTTTLSASGATSYTWAGGPVSMDYTVSPNATTVYTLIGTDVNGCSNTAAPTTLTITVLSSPTLALATSISTNTLCSGNSATITLAGASAGSTYTLFPGALTSTVDFVVNPTTTTDYTVMATDNANGCVSSTASQIYTTTVTVATSPTITLSSVAPSSTLCSGQSATLSVSGASSYTLINTNSSAEPFVVTPSITTTYTVAGTGANGCINLSNTDLITTITVNQTPTISLLSVSPSQTVCAGQSATITANGASSYTLINTNATASPFVVTPTVSTTYSIVGTSANGCVSDNASGLTLTIDIGSGILVSSSSTSVTCFGGNNGAITVSVTSASAYGYLWSNGMTTGAISNLTAGVYSLTVTDANNCKAFNTTTINEPNDIFITAQSNTPSCDNAPTGSIALNITGGTPSYAVLWSNGAVGSTVNNLPVGVITATITDNNACVKNHSETVSEEKCITTTIPNLLSPNGDGKNEPFFINTIDYFPNNKLEIYNRWGNLVYSKEKYDNTFNGKANVSNANGNGLLPAGTYFVIFEFGDDKTPTYKGYFDLKY